MEKNRKTRIKRGYVQAAATLLSNLHLPNFLKGNIYSGAAKRICVPGLNCYSCPGALGACPIGAFQAVVNSSKFSFAYYVTGLLLLFGVLAGRLICGFLCPFGWFQDLLHKIPSQKFSTRKLKALTYLKYIILVGIVWLMGAFLVDGTGIALPYFCKYICPQGILEGAIPLAIANKTIKAGLGALFTWKFALLTVIVILSIFLYRPFCKWLCPLGAFYALLNKVSFYQYRVDQGKCTKCGACGKACGMEVEIHQNPCAAECIRCGECLAICPVGAITSEFRLSAGKSQNQKTQTTETLEQTE